MSSTTQLSLSTPLRTLGWIDPMEAAELERLNITRVIDLIKHLPMRYEMEHSEQTISQVDQLIGPDDGDASNVAIRGTVLSIGYRRGRRPRIDVEFSDETGTINLSWFNAPWMQRKLEPGIRGIAAGRIRRANGVLQMANPQWTMIDEEQEPPPRRSRIRPIYPGSERLNSSRIESMIDQILDEATRQLVDPLDQSFRAEREFPNLHDAYQWIHRPDDDEAATQARRRLAYDELLLLQLGVMMRRQQLRGSLKATALDFDDKIDGRIRDRFPFPLTDHQDQAINEIVHDLSGEIPMNRLLQGDVGSGKTVVALYAMLMAVASGHQAALLAPTELLAEQHERSIRSMLSGSKVNVRLVTGSLAAQQRAEITRDLAQGRIDIIIGTHALLNQDIMFRNLAVAIVDEQHRFGVQQRAVMRGRSTEVDTVPHLLVMTATPIPRSMSLTIFGDLDLSVIKGLPPGRKPVSTRVVGPSRRMDVYGYVDQQLQKGEQAYIVVPAIEQTETGLIDVQGHLDRLADGPLRGRRLEALHGRIARQERDRIMAEFREGRIDALVATVVIEVGVDVPNATIMVIEQADRFGLAQLHQLRGRVGRGTKGGLCTLVADTTTDEATQRLEAIRSTTDGFEVAEMDLAIRGPGELFGHKQSGLPPLSIADLNRDGLLLRLARQDASEWLDRNPQLMEPEDDLLRRKVLSLYGDVLELGDVG
ncbi:MAG: ATP-dependent DNA helicase RecG [Phycisphaerae bacterium]|nr:ATP-dependent DNA helicase RecG [Phycisphaerae bacterium]